MLFCSLFVTTPATKEFGSVHPKIRNVGEKKEEGRYYRHVFSKCSTQTSTDVGLALVQTVNEIPCMTQTVKRIRSVFENQV